MNKLPCQNGDKQHPVWSQVKKGDNNKSKMAINNTCLSVIANRIIALFSV